MADLVEDLRVSGPLGQRGASEITALREQLLDCSASYRRLVVNAREDLQEARDLLRRAREAIYTADLGTDAPECVAAIDIFLERRT